MKDNRRLTRFGYWLKESLVYDSELTQKDISQCIGVTPQYLSALLYRGTGKKLNNRIVNNLILCRKFDPVKYNELWDILQKQDVEVIIYKICPDCSREQCEIILNKFYGLFDKELNE